MLKFHKYHGNGNDFIIINKNKSDIKITKSFVAKAADRNNGIGFDQLIVVSKSNNKPDFKIDFYNADGSMADMCLNGIRCAAEYIWSNKLSKKKILNLVVKSKSILCEKHEKHKGLIECVLDLPRTYDNVKLEKQLAKYLKPEVYSLIEVGNLHLCINKRGIKTLDLGQLYEQLRKIIKPYKINLSVYKKSSNNNVEIRTYENGAGETLSCGSASASVAFLNTKELNKPINILSKGGKLEFNVKENTITMSGPATFVFSGEISG